MAARSPTEPVVFSPLKSAELIGNMLIKLGKIDSANISRIVSHQEQARLPFGESAIALGLITRDDLLQVLAAQFEYPCQIAEPVSRFPGLVTLSEPFGGEAENYRALRSKLMLKSVQTEDKMLAIVPVMNAESATEIAANLAVSYAQSGLRTLLVDSNMRTPSAHKLFEVAGNPGLSDVLIGRTPLRTAIVPIEEIPSLSLLSAGLPPPNPQELLIKPLYRSFVQTVSHSYDMVILTTAAAARFADAAIVAMHANATVLTLNRDADSANNAGEAKRLLLECQARILGAVLCGANGRFS